MEAEFQITRDDYVAAGLLNGEMTRKAKYIHYSIDAVLIVLGIAALYVDRYILAGGLIGAAIGVIFSHTLYEAFMFLGI